MAYHFQKRLRSKKGKSVFQYSLDGKYIKTWPYAKKASVVLGIDYTSILGVCKGKSITAGGFIWRYNNGTYIEGRR